MTANRDSRELVWRVAFGGPCLVAAVLAVLLLPGGHAFSAIWPLAIALLIVSMRLELHVPDAGTIGCFQAAFVFLLFTIPVNLVPIVALGCSFVAQPTSLAKFRNRPIAMVVTAAMNNLYSVIASVLLATLAPGLVNWAHWHSYALAFGGQFVGGYAIFAMWRLTPVGRGGRLRFSEEAPVFVVDGALTVIGLSAAVAARSSMAAGVALMIAATALLALNDREHRRRRAESERAVRDALTGLANRALFDEASLACEARCLRKNENAALLLIDLDHFKPINDTLGHQAGDEVLRAVADRIRLATRASDITARVGGDEFAIILAEPADIEGAQKVADAIRERLTQPIVLTTGEEVTISCSSGAATFGSSGPVQDALVQADAALYREKRSHKLKSDRSAVNANA